MKTKLLILLIFATGFLNAQINDKSVDDVVNIPDFYFKQLLLFRYDTNNDNEIQVAEAEAVTEMIEVYGDPFVWGQITDLTGIEAFVNSVGLNCKLNLITSLDISQNLAFQTVDCSYNELTSINLGANTNLTELYCFENNLSSLDVSQNTDLEIIDCSNNNLSSIDVTTNINLEVLYCSFNNIDDINLINNNQLKYLSVLSNNLTELIIINNILLQELFMGENPITSVDLSQNGALYYFACAFSDLTIIDLTNNEEIETLVCNNNHLTSLDIRNGNNTNFSYFNSTDNPNLKCIFVDDAQYSTDYWLLKDETSYFVENETQCETAYVKEQSFNTDIFPNPANDNFIINTELSYDKLFIYNCLGNSVKKFNKQNSYSIKNLPKGIYFIKIVTSKGNITKKIIKE